MLMHQIAVTSQICKPINTASQLIEQEFQDYFKVLLIKQDEDCYSVPEWDSHFAWGNRLFTLKQLQVLLKGYHHLSKIVPEIQSFSWLEKEKLTLKQ